MQAPLPYMNMEHSTQQLVVPKIEENPLVFDSLQSYYQDPFLKTTTSTFDVPLLDNFPHEFDTLEFGFPLQCSCNQLPYMGFDDFNTWDFTAFDNRTATVSSLSRCDYEAFDAKPLKTMVESNNIVPDGFASPHCDENTARTMVESCDYLNNAPSNLVPHEASLMMESSGFLSPHCDSMVFDEKPLLTMVDSFNCSNNLPPDFGHDELPMKIENGNQIWNRSHVKMALSSNAECYKAQMKCKSGQLELEEIKRHFNLPITKAANELKVGVTLLKRRCRELNIMRWPHRKLKSLNSLIQIHKVRGLRNAVKMLEEDKRLLEQYPSMDLPARTKKLRQAIFKANHKKKRFLMIAAAAAAGP